jgi:glucosamine--fructose-6-phosphate aminotransferase (isomerizing)
VVAVCGIIGYIGDRAACEVIVKGLKRLEYRGYDSAGVVTEDGGKLFIKKGAGVIDELTEKLGLLKMPGKRGIGHTRWATHGVPSDVNAHPHNDCTGKIVGPISVQFHLVSTCKSTGLARSGDDHDAF